MSAADEGVRLQLGSVVQLAYLVEDVREAAGEWARRSGAGPFFVRHHPPIADTDRGVQLNHTSAYGQWGAVQVELVQLHAGRSPALTGMLGLHHVAYFVADVEAEQHRLDWPLVMSAVTASGIRFSFLDARAERGHLVELYEPHPRLLELYDQVAGASRGWDGRDPVRELR